MIVAAMDRLLLQQTEEFVQHVSARIDVSIEDDDCFWSQQRVIENNLVLCESVPLRAMVCASPLSWSWKQYVFGIDWNAVGKNQESREIEEKETEQKD